MAYGTVKWFNSKKGYGFISSDLGERDVFVHITALKASGIETLEGDERVEFELHQMGDGRTIAEGIKLLDRTDSNDADEEE